MQKNFQAKLKFLAKKIKIKISLKNPMLYRVFPIIRPAGAIIRFWDF